MQCGGQGKGEIFAENGIAGNTGRRMLASALLSTGNRFMKDDSKTKVQPIEELRKMRILVGNLPDFVFVADEKGVVSFLSRTLPQHSEEDVLGKTIYDFLLPEFHDLARRAIGQVFSTGEPGTWESEAQGPQGSISYYHTRCMPLKRAGKVHSFIGVSTDVTDRKQAEEALQSEKLRSAQYLNSLPGLFYVFDELSFVKWNKEWNKVTGYSNDEIAGMYGPDFFKGEDKKHIEERMLKVFSDGSADAQAYIVTKTGRRIPYYFTGVRKNLNGKDHLVGLGIDITERVQAEEDRLRLEQQVQQTQKMESLGVLAGGIAHDFNNLLMGIMGNADLALLDMAPEAPARKNLCSIEKATKRAADLAKQMLAYSGKGRFVIKRMDLQTLIEEMVYLLEVSISKKVVIKYDFAQSVSPIKADATQIRQIIMNLVINASEAIGNRSGVISIRTGAMKCDRDYLDETYLDDNLAEGSYSYLEVSDTGGGMNEETILKIFDPFFTTKFTGRGLGLAAALGIIRGHKGAVKVYSEMGKGTTFKVLFPVSQGATHKNDLPGDFLDCSELKGKNVLLVDDEETVRTVGRQMLERLGLKVTTAVDGSEALNLFEQDPNRFDCIILDLTMPHLDGEETFREMRRIRKNVSAILSSGYNEQDLIARFASKGFVGFIQKPYRTAEIGAALAKAFKKNSKQVARDSAGKP
jgi:PAS domain S-box-containing protein